MSLSIEKIICDALSVTKEGNYSIRSRTDKHGDLMAFVYNNDTDEVVFEFGYDEGLSDLEIRMRMLSALIICGASSLLKEGSIDNILIESNFNFFKKENKLSESTDNYFVQESQNANSVSTQITESQIENALVSYVTSIQDQTYADLNTEMERRIQNGPLSSTVIRSDSDYEEIRRREYIDEMRRVGLIQ